jgi:hypothetical protein
MPLPPNQICSSSPSPQRYRKFGKNDPSAQYDSILGAARSERPI